MSGLPLMKDAFANGGPSAAAGAAADRAATGHRRPSADGNAFAEIVSSLGPAQARPEPRVAEGPGEAATPPGRLPLPGSPVAALEPAAGATLMASGPRSAPDMLGPASRLEAASALEPAVALGVTPAHRAASVAGGAAALAPSTPSGTAAGLGAGLQAALAGATAPTGADPNRSDALPPDTGAVSSRPATDHDDQAAVSILPDRQPPAAVREGRVPIAVDVPADRDTARADGPSVEDAPSGGETPRTDTVDAGAERAPRLDTIAQPPPAAPSTGPAGVGAADADRAVALLPGAPAANGQATGTPTAAGETSASPGTRPSGSLGAPSAPAEPDARLPGAGPSDPATMAAFRDTAPGSKATQEASLPRPATPVPAQGTASAGTPVETGAAQPALPATTATTPLGSASAADAPAQASGTGGGRVSAQVRDMRTHFAPVVPRTLAATVGGKPEAAAAAGAAPAAMQAAAPTVEAELARTVTAPSAAPAASSAQATAPSTAQATLAAASSPTVIGAAGADEVGGPPSATARAVTEGVRGSEPRETAPPVATTPDQRVTQRPEGAAARRADVSETTNGATTVAETAPVAASPDGATPTTSAGSPTDLPLRTLAQEIGRVARPIAADGGSQLATTTAGQPNALRRDVEVELSAPEFGVVRVRMRLHGSSLELRLRTDDPATLALLAERRTELERAISEVGVDAKVVDVSRTAASASAASPSSPGGQAPTSDGGRGGEGQPFDQRPSPDRNDRRPPFDRQTDGSMPDEDPTARAGTRPGTLFV